MIDLSSGGDKQGSVKARKESSRMVLSLTEEVSERKLERDLRGKIYKRKKACRIIGKVELRTFTTTSSQASRASSPRCRLTIQLTCTSTFSEN